MSKRQHRKVFKKGAIFKVIRKFPIRNGFKTGDIVRCEGGGLSEKTLVCKNLDKNQVYLIHTSQLKPLYLKGEPLCLEEEECVEQVVIETKVFHIDQCSPPIDFASHKSYYSGMNGYEVVLSSAQVDKINEMDFDCNHSNNRNQNLNTLKALLGKDIEKKWY